MKNKKMAWAIMLLAAFIGWTAAVLLVDVQPMGPNGSAVGFAALNGWFHSVTGMHWALYTLTDWLSIVPAAVCAGFGCLGFWQWVKRKSIANVDKDILLLGAFYLAVIGAYLFFENYAVNCRPVLVEGVLETSYPSSTTLLVLCVMPAAMLQWKRRIRHGVLRKRVLWAAALFTAGMFAGRLISGVHWLSDIIGGILLSAGLVLGYAGLAFPKRQ